MNIIKAERVTVKFCEGVEVDAYKLPNGEYRVGRVGASIAIGYAKNYLTELAKKSPNQLKALQQKGFSGLEANVELDSIKGGGTIASTISLQDFRKLIVFASSKGKPKAAALLDAIVDTGLEDWIRLSFGDKRQTLEEKRHTFYRTYSQTINWALEDREDWKQIEEQERFLREE